MTNSNSSISRHYHQLNSVQRGQIQALLDLGITSPLLLEKLAVTNRQLAVKSDVAASCKEIITICSMRITMPILRRSIMISDARTAISVIS